MTCSGGHDHLTLLFVLEAIAVGVPWLLGAWLIASDARRAWRRWRSRR